MKRMSLIELLLSYNSQYLTCDILGSCISLLYYISLISRLDLYSYAVIMTRNAQWRISCKFSIDS